MAKAQPSTAANEPTFETAIQRLDQIVQAMDAEELPLEDMIARYEEGARLLQICEAKLQAAEKKIEIINRQTQGRPELAEFDPAETPAAKPRADVNLF